MKTDELSELSPITTLLARLSTLEVVINGPANDNSNSLLHHIKECGNQLTVIEESIPDLNPCRKLLDKVTPIVSMHRSRINSIIEKSEELISRERSILQTIGEVQQVQKLSSHLSTEELTDLVVEEAKVIEIKDLLISLQNECQRQTQELDQAMDFYERSMLLLASISSAWDSRLIALGV